MLSFEPERRLGSRLGERLGKDSGKDWGKDWGKTGERLGERLGKDWDAGGASHAMGDVRKNPMKSHSVLAQSLQTPTETVHQRDEGRRKPTEMALRVG